MVRSIFYSFHFDGDFWRTQTVRNIGAFEHDSPVSKNDWETVKSGGDAAIKRWVAGQLNGKSCLVCLVGAETAERPWVRYEINEAWNSGKGVVGIRIHRLLDTNKQPSVKGRNPFDRLTFKGSDDRKLSSVVRLYDPGLVTSKIAYEWIAANLEAAVEEAIRIRAQYKG